MARVRNRSSTIATPASPRSAPLISTRETTATSSARPGLITPDSMRTRAASRAPAPAGLMNATKPTHQASANAVTESTSRRGEKAMSPTRSTRTRVCSPIASHEATAQAVVRSAPRRLIVCSSGGRRARASTRSSTRLSTGGHSSASSGSTSTASHR